MPATTKPKDYHSNVFLGHWADPTTVKALKRHARRRKLPLAVLLREGDLALLVRLDAETPSPRPTGAP